jgi:hypothetical protein
VRRGRLRVRQGERSVLLDRDGLHERRRRVRLHQHLDERPHLRQVRNGGRALLREQHLRKRWLLRLHVFVDLRTIWQHLHGRRRNLRHLHGFDLLGRGLRDLRWAHATLLLHQHVLPVHRPEHVLLDPGLDRRLPALRGDGPTLLRGLQLQHGGDLVDGDLQHEPHLPLRDHQLHLPALALGGRPRVAPRSGS